MKNLSPSPDAAFRWTFPGCPLTIDLDLAMVDPLAREVEFRDEILGPEIAGLLLGRTNPSGRLVEVVSYAPIAPADRADGRFVLAGAALEKLAQELEARKLSPQLAVVGFYRTSLAPALHLNADDLKLMRSHFADPQQVFLIIKPRKGLSATAGFFFWDGKKIFSDFSFIEFPLNASELTTADHFWATHSTTALPGHNGNPVHEPNGAVPERELDGDEESAQLGPEEVRSQVNSLLERMTPQMPPLPDTPRVKASPPPPRRLRWAFLAGVFGVLMLVAGAFVDRLFLGALFPAFPPAQTSPDIPVAPDLGLKVEQSDQFLKVSWRQNEPAILQSTGGSITITDGDAAPKTILFDGEQMRTSAVAYFPQSANVRMTFEVARPGARPLSQSLLAVMGRPVSGADGGDAFRLQNAAAKPLPASTQRPVKTAEQQDKAAPPAAKITPPAEAVRVNATASVVQEPKSPDAAKDFVRPRALHNVKPGLSESARALVTGPVTIELRLMIDDTGRVTGVQPISRSGPDGAPDSALEALSNAAVANAAAWRFSPSKSGREAVPGETMLRFRFSPAKLVNKQVKLK